jgi:hypothetical protein
MNKNSIQISKQENIKSFALIEVIVALFIITTGIIGTYILLISTISSTNYATNRFTAAYLAQEGIELVRNVRDTNWIQLAHWKEGLDTITTDCSGNCTGVSDGTEGCIADYRVSLNKDVDLSASTNYTGPYFGQKLKYDSNDLYNYTVGAETKFKRQINITELSYYGLEVCVWVGWEERGINYNIVVRENLYNWR